MFVFVGDDEEVVLEVLLEVDVDVKDIECDDGMIIVLVFFVDYFKVKMVILEINLEMDFEVQEIIYLLFMFYLLVGDDVEQFECFVGLFNEFEDVQEIYYNGEFEDVQSVVGRLLVMCFVKQVCKRV